MNITKNFLITQICSNCEYKNKDVKNLTVREWDCPSCGTHHDRDRNVTLNLRNKAIRLLTVGTKGIAYSIRNRYVSVLITDWKVVVSGDAAYGSLGGEAKFGTKKELSVGLGIGLGIKFGAEKG